MRRGGVPHLVSVGLLIVSLCESLLNTPRCDLNRTLLAQLCVPASWQPLAGTLSESQIDHGAVSPIAATYENG